MFINTPEQSVIDFIKDQFIPGGPVDIDPAFDATLLSDVFNRMQHQWTIAGEQNPYASVLSESRFSREEIERNRSDFDATGSFALEKLVALCKKNKVHCPRTELFELGAGVGRSTVHFAHHFEKVYGWDISAGNLDECEWRMRSRGIVNVALQLVTSLHSYLHIPEHDVFFSEITLQHNPPPLQLYILRCALSRLKPNGLFFFQTITHHPKYSFSYETYLTTPQQDQFELHALPMRHIFETIARSGAQVLDVAKDRMGGFNVDSFTFFGRK